MDQALMIFHLVISVLLIIMVLLQFGKGAEAGLMSGGGADTVFTSAQQGNILVKITIVLSILFMGNSILLAKLKSSQSTKSLLDSETPITRPLNSDASAEKKSITVEKTEAKTPEKAADQSKTE